MTIQPHRRLTIEVFMLPTAWYIFSNAMPRFITTENRNAILEKTIKDYGVDEKDFLDRLDAMVEQAFDDQCTGANPRFPLFKEIKQMYLNAYYGTHEKV